MELMEAPVADAPNFSSDVCLMKITKMNCACQHQHS